MRFLQFQYTVIDGTAYLKQFECEDLVLFMYVCCLQLNLGIPFSTQMVIDSDTWNTVLLDCKYRVVLTPEHLGPWDTVVYVN